MFTYFKIRRLLREAREPFRSDESIADRLAAIGPEAVPRLVAAMADTKAAKLALIRLGPAARSAVIAALRDPNGDRRFAATEVLADTADKSALEPLVQATGDAVSTVRWGAACALGAIGDKRALPALARLARDPDDFVRRITAQELARFDDPQSIAALVPLIADRDSWVRRAAIEAAAKFRHPDLIAALRRATGDDDESLRRLAVATLVDQGDGAGVLAALAHGDPAVRAEAARSLARVPLDAAQRERAVPALLAELRRMGSHADSVAEGLRAFADPRAVGPLAELLAKNSAAIPAYNAMRGILGKAVAEVASADLRAVARLQEIDIVVGTYERACTRDHPVISDEPIYGPLGVAGLVQMARQELIRRGEPA